MDAPPELGRASRAPSRTGDDVSAFDHFDQSTVNAFLGSHMPPSTSAAFAVTAPDNALRKLTVDLVATYQTCNPSFRLEPTVLPRRPLTHPAIPAGNNRLDNKDGDLIVHVNDVFVSPNQIKYRVIDRLGRGTYGQVFKCQNLQTKQLVAIKVIRNHTAYFQQSLSEVRILNLLNRQYDPEDERHIVRMLDSFTSSSHLIIVVELLSMSLYELLKANQFRGLGITLVKRIATQMLEALATMEEADVIHGDIKPENVLLNRLDSSEVKLVDFGSACLASQTVGTYVQSRFYRAPEVILGAQYGREIDLWSLGCVIAELFVGMPLFPGANGFDQIARITSMVGMPPDRILERGRTAPQFFRRETSSFGTQYRLKSQAEYESDAGESIARRRPYFQYSSLYEIIMHYPYRRGMSEEQVQWEMGERHKLSHFLRTLLSINPEQRRSASKLLRHPFISGENTPLMPMDDGRRTPTARTPHISSNSSVHSAPAGAGTATGPLRVRRPSPHLGAAPAVLAEGDDAGSVAPRRSPRARRPELAFLRPAPLSTSVSSTPAGGHAFSPGHRSAFMSVSTSDTGSLVSGGSLRSESETAPDPAPPPPVPLQHERARVAAPATAAAPAPAPASSSASSAADITHGMARLRPPAAPADVPARARTAGPPRASLSSRAAAHGISLALKPGHRRVRSMLDERALALFADTAGRGRELFVPAVPPVPEEQAAGAGERPRHRRGFG